MAETILHINSSARHQGSVTRDLTARILADRPQARVITRDLAEAPIPQITENWVAANFTPAEDRTDTQKQELALSDLLVDELAAADTILIGLSVYNFSLPASLKAWIDQIARVGRTFQYTSEGPKGLLAGKRAIITFASGGVPLDSPVDFATPYLRHVLGFVGITDVTVVAAEGTNGDASASVAKALQQIEELGRAA